MAPFGEDAFSKMKRGPGGVPQKQAWHPGNRTQGYRGKTKAKGLSNSKPVGMAKGRPANQKKGINIPTGMSVSKGEKSARKMNVPTKRRP
jgi:hypothetical protein